MAQPTPADRETAFTRVMQNIRATNPASEAAFTAQCQAYGTCPQDMNEARAETLLTFLHETYGMEIAMTLLADLVTLQNCKEKVDALRSATPRGLTNAAAAVAAPDAQDGAHSEAAIISALERDRKLREEFAATEAHGDTVENLKNYKFLEVWAGEDGNKHKETLSLCAEFLANTTHKVGLPGKEVLYNSWIIKSKNEWGQLQDRIISISSAAYYRLTFDETALKVTNYMRMPLEFIHAISQPTTITISIKSNREDGEKNAITSIFAKKDTASERLYCPQSLSISRIDKAAIAEEIVTTFKRAWEIFKGQQEAK